MTDIRITGAGYGCGMSRADRSELEEKASTDAILKTATASSGRKSEAVALAPLATYRDTKASQQLFASWSHDAKDIAIGTTHAALEFAEHAIARAAPRLAAAASPVGAALVAFEIVSLLPQALRHGDDRALALNRDARFLALVYSVEGLPPAYVQGEIAKRPEVTGKEQSPANEIAFALRCDKPAVAVLQIRVDEGMKVAEQCSAARLVPQAFFGTRPELGARYQVDAAFRIGFDAMMHAHIEGGPTLESTLTELRKRDARCDSTFNLVFTG